MSKPTNPKINFSTSMAELEKITAWFESGDVDLDKGLVQFERGMEIIAELKDYLSKVENRVEQVKQKFDRPIESTSGKDLGEPDLN